MKRVLFTLCMVLSIILILLCAKKASWSADTLLKPKVGAMFTIGKYTFEITSPTEVELDDVDKSVSSVNVSPTITYQGTTYRVTSIGLHAFLDCSKLTSVTIPNSVTSIGDGAFSRCTFLTSITIPNSMTSIGDGAFSSCSSLTSITIPNTVTSIGYGAFDGCSSLTSVTIPNSVTSIGEDAFEGTGIYTNAANWKNGALYINNCLIRVKEDFMGDYTIKAGTRLIAGGAFDGCESLTSITIPNSVISIGEFAFDGCTSLTSVTIPNSVISIGGRAFENCSSLISVTIPNSVTSIGEDAFEGTGIYTNAANWKNGALYINNCLIRVKEDFMGDYTIKAGTRLIANGAFDGCSSLTSVTIPNSVTSIGGDAFDGCTSLTSITIPNSVTSIGRDAFWNCSSLTSAKYTGTKEQWNKIEKSGWTENSKIQVVRCTDGEIRL